MAISLLVLAFGCANASDATGATAGSDEQSGANVGPVSYVCENSPKDPDFPRYARLMHDYQWMEYPSRIADPDWPSGFYLDWYPQTVQLWTGPKGGDGRLPYSREWLEYLRALQPNNAAAEWITRIAAGLFNRTGNEYIPILNLDALKDDPVAESISTGGNVVKVLETKSGSARLEMIYFRYAVPSPDKINYTSTPWLVTKFTAISVDGQIGNADGQDVYFPNLAKQKEGYWVAAKRIEFFPSLPYCVTVNQNVEVVTNPTGLAKQVTVLKAGDTVTVRSYLPQASDVWGEIDGGWIRLEYLNAAGVPVYPTSWQMETRPPILFP